MPECTDRWNASLRLGFSARESGRSVLDVREHYGPILVQRALYPEGPEICHVAILHPPAGIAGGDAIDINVDVRADARATITTPGATRWYKANARQASQSVRLRVAAGGRLDWLPLENLFFEETDAVSRHRIELESGAAAIGWEISQLGRVTKPNFWDCGNVRVQTSLAVDGRLIWIDQGHVGAVDDVRWSVSGLAGFPVYATLWCFGPRLASEQAEELVALMPWHEGLRGGSTLIPHDVQQALYLVRGVGIHVEEIMEWMVKVWSYLRPAVLQTPAVPLRLWKT